MTKITTNQTNLAVLLGEATVRAIAVENRGKELSKELNKSNKTSNEAARAELNLAMKELALSKFKWTGTARSNPTVKAVAHTLAQAGLADQTVADTLSALKWAYTNGVEVSTLNPTRLKRKEKHTDLLSGAEKIIPTAKASCAKTIIKGMSEPEWGKVAQEAILAVLDACDIHKDEVHDPAGAMNAALLAAMEKHKLIKIDTVTDEVTVIK